MDEADERELLRRALDEGDEAALELLFKGWLPVIQACVARCLYRWRRGPAASRYERQEVEGLTKEVLIFLFDQGGKVLRMWQPERGLPLHDFIALVAERRVVSILRSRRSAFWEPKR